MIPSNPVPSVGGHSCCSWTSGPQGQFDQSSIEQRPDILVYSSAPLKQAMEVTGQITVTLYAKTTAPDTDFTAKLVDVAPDGTRSTSPTASRRRVIASPCHTRRRSCRDRSIIQDQCLADLNLFKLGHRIRIEISSSDFPQFAANSKHRRPFGTGTNGRKRRKPSCMMPRIPRP